GIGAHAPRTLRRKVLQLGNEPAGAIEKLLRSVTLHPVFESLQMFGRVHFSHRHLMRAPSSFDLLAVDFFGARPTFGRTQDNHRPARPADRLVAARLLL